MFAQHSRTRRAVRVDEMYTLARFPRYAELQTQLFAKIPEAASMNNELLVRKIEPRELAAETNIFTSYLSQIGLPTRNVIATTSERDIVASNLPSFLDTMSADEKRDARYLSKFVGATAIGLFDAALNYIWNEVVLNLRQKVVVYGLDLFFDAAVGGKMRGAYKDESDLAGIKDSVLLDTCSKLELISDIVYRKLDHILTMRNEVAASHPNVESIGGYELLGWMQTCVKDVLQDRPSESAIRIKSIVSNVRSATSVIDADMARRFEAELKNLSLPHIHNLLITFFGIFVGRDADQVQRKNISLLAPGIWEHAEEAVRYRVGAMIDGYRANLEKDKLAHGIEFLGIVDGKAYESLPARLVALENLCSQLRDAHSGYDNFYREPPLMAEILSYCKRSTDIPKELMPMMVRTVLTCRIGRGLSYRQGVSPAGSPMYDQFFSMLDDNGVAHSVRSLFLPELNSKLQNAICQQHLVAVLNTLKGITIAERLKQALDFLLAHPDKAYRARYDEVFQELTAPFIRW